MASVQGCPDAVSEGGIVPNGSWHLERCGKGRRGAQCTDQLRIERCRLTVTPERRPIHEVPVREIRDQIVRPELTLESGEGALNRRKDRLDRFEIAGVQQMHVGIEDPLHGPIGDEDGIGPVIAGSEA